MKLGRDTCSMMNYLRGNSAPVDFKVGDGCTILGWSDRHACTVIEVNEKNTRMKIQQDTATRTDENGMSDSQQYSYEPNPHGAVYEVTRRKDGSWRLKGERATVAAGRSEYYDYSF